MKDICLNTSGVLITKERDLILQQVDILFDTDECEVFGEEHYGCDFRRFLWDLKISNSQISEYTENLIMSNVDLLGWELDVDTTILEGTNNDIILITITISKELTQYEKTYKIV